MRGQGTGDRGQGRCEAQTDREKTYRSGTHLVRHPRPIIPYTLHLAPDSALPSFERLYPLRELLQLGRCGTPKRSRVSTGGASRHLQTLDVVFEVGEAGHEGGLVFDDGICQFPALLVSCCHPCCNWEEGKAADGR